MSCRLFLPDFNCGSHKKNPEKQTGISAIFKSLREAEIFKIPGVSGVSNRSALKHEH